MVANLMFDLDPITMATHERSGGGLWLGEAVATLGLVLVIFGSARSGRTDTIAYAVGGYITAAYWFTSSTSFANPAVTVARMFSDSFAGIAPSSVAMFVVMQVIGGVLAVLVVKLLYPLESLRTPPPEATLRSDTPASATRTGPSPTPAGASLDDARSIREDRQTQ